MLRKPRGPRGWQEAENKPLPAAQPVGAGRLGPGVTEDLGRSSCARPLFHRSPYPAFSPASPSPPFLSSAPDLHLSLSLSLVGCSRLRWSLPASAVRHRGWTALHSAAWSPRPGACLSSTGPAAQPCPCSGPCWSPQFSGLSPENRRAPSKAALEPEGPGRQRLSAAASVQTLAFYETDLKKKLFL